MVNISRLLVLLQNLKYYYRVSSYLDLYKSLVIDFFVSCILFSGSGLFTSFLKGILSHIFIRSGFILIGNRFRIKHPYNVKLGNNIRIKNDVSMLAYGPLKIGNNCVIAEKTTLISVKAGLSIGDNVVIGQYCYIAQNGGKISIGNNVLISDFVRIYTLNHEYIDRKKLIKDQKCTYVQVIIEDNVLIGSGVVIFNNVTIGSGSVIGANSVVNSDIPNNVVFAGNPARFIKKIR